MRGHDAMGDMNFFSSYNKKGEKKTGGKSNTVINVIVILILTGAVSMGLYNLFVIRNLNREIQSLSIELEALKKDPKLKEIQAKVKQVSDYKSELSKLVELDKYIESIDKVNEYILQDIRSNTPPELFLKSMVMTHEGIKIEGVSKDKGSIAQFGHNLTKVRGLEKTFISQVTDEGENYKFYLDIDLKEEIVNESEAGKQ